MLLFGIIHTAQNGAETEEKYYRAQRCRGCVGYALGEVNARHTDCHREEKSKRHEQNNLSEYRYKQTYFRLGERNERCLASALHAEYEHARYEYRQILFGERKQVRVGRKHSAEHAREYHHYECANTAVCPTDSESYEIRAFEPR